VDQYAVAGHPIAHSRSPFIHQLFAEQTGESLCYGAMDVAEHNFHCAVTEFKRSGGRGLNLTLPLKVLACGYADVCSERVTQAGAANTLSFALDGRVYADNTDGLGLIRDLTSNFSIRLSGCKILLIGAGGAARGVLAPLLSEHPQCLVIANRTQARAEQLCREFGHAGILTSMALGDIGQGQFHLVINATSASLKGQLLPIGKQTFAPGACCYDMLYSHKPTAFLRQAGQFADLKLCDGRGMLVEQAAESFLIWRGVRPQTQSVIAALDKALAGEND